MDNLNKIKPIEIIIVLTLLTLLIIAGIISYKSIDWQVLDRLENQELILPTPIPTTTASNSATATESTQLIQSQTP